MQIKADTVEEYISKVPDDRKEAIIKLRDIVKSNMPEGFEEVISYGMIGYVVPKSRYPDGYHTTPDLPLSFINIANQKNHIAYYNSGMYADPNLLNWFVEEYPKHSKFKLDMGKSCVRFKKPDRITYDLLGELTSKMSVDEWIEIYEKAIKK